MARILVVDDNESILRICARILARGGHEVVLANTREEAHEVAANLKLDLAIVDMRLTSSRGTDLLDELLLSYDLPTGLLMSGAFERSARLRLPRSGRVLPTVAKPLDPTTLLDAVADAVLPQDAETREAC